MQTDGKSELNRARLYLLISLVWMAVIFAFSHQAYSGRITEAYLGESANVPVRKLGHVTEFGVLAWLYLRTMLAFAAARGAVLKPRLAYILAFGLAFAYACLDEWHQAFVPGRSSSFYDVLVDSTGMVIALVVTAIVTARAKKKGPSAQTQ